MSEKHFLEQRAHAEQYLIPYLERHVPGFRRLRVLEVGCAEAGLLAALSERGVDCAGLELEPHRAALARSLCPLAEVRVGDITDPALPGRLGGEFGAVVMRDVIEHVADRDAAFKNLRLLLRPGGFLYVSFPPRWSPFAGHHQNGVSALRRVPWLHLLPPPALRALGRRFGEAPHVVEQATRNFRKGLGVSAFRALARRHGFTAAVWELFWIRPVFRTRFGLRPRRFPDLPGLHEIALGCEALLRRGR